MSDEDELMRLHAATATPALEQLCWYDVKPEQASFFEACLEDVPKLVAERDALKAVVSQRSEELVVAASEYERLRAEVAHNAEREQQAIAMLGERHRADVEQLRAELSVAEDKWLEYGSEDKPGVHALWTQRRELAAQLTELRADNERLRAELAEAIAWRDRWKFRAEKAEPDSVELASQLRELREAAEDLEDALGDELDADDMEKHGKTIVALAALQGVLAKVPPRG